MKRNTKRARLTLELTTENFRRICALNRMTPAECIAKSGKAQDTVYKALRNPRQFTPTIKILETLLPDREVLYV